MIVGDRCRSQCPVSYVVSMLHTTYTWTRFFEKYRLRLSRKKGPNFSCRLRKKDAQQFLSPAAKNVGRLKSRVALCAKRLCGPKCCARATAQQLTNALVVTYPRSCGCNVPTLPCCQSCHMHRYIQGAPRAASLTWRYPMRTPSLFCVSRHHPTRTLRLNIFERFFFCYI